MGANLRDGRFPDRGLLAFLDRWQANAASRIGRASTIVNTALTVWTEKLLVREFCEVYFTPNLQIVNRSRDADIFGRTVEGRGIELCRVK